MTEQDTNIFTPIAISKKTDIRNSGDTIEHFHTLLTDIEGEFLSQYILKTTITLELSQN